MEFLKTMSRNEAIKQLLLEWNMDVFYFYSQNIFAL